MCSCSSNNVSLSDEIKVLIYFSLQECLEKCGESLQEIINYHMVSLSALQNVHMLHVDLSEMEQHNGFIWCLNGS